jgi:pimeloyl-ACP methyl ester carboxylesterase
MERGGGSKRLYLDIRGVRLCCVDFGGEGPPVLLLHGLAGRANEWRSTAVWMTESYRVLALDQRGHGMSDKDVSDYSRGAYVEDVVAVIQRLGLGPVVLVGQSMGGLNAFLAAARRPDLARALVVVEASPGGPDPKVPGRVGAWLDSWPVPFPTLADARDFFGGDTLYAQAWLEVLEEHPDGYRPQFRRESMVASVADVAERNYWGEWGRVRCPTLSVGGTRGYVAEDELREMTRRIPSGSYARIPGAGHDLHLERPEAWREVAEAFLSSTVGDSHGASGTG